MPTDIAIPAKETMEYTYMIVPTGFTEDRWVHKMEVRAGNRAVVHHANVRAGSAWPRKYPVGVPFVPDEQKSSWLAGAPLLDENLAGLTPGKQTVELKSDQAKLIPGGSDIVFQMHYTATGTAATDRSRWDSCSRSRRRKSVWLVLAANTSFTIPPGADDYRVEASATRQSNTDLASVKPHMHLRGKWIEFRAVYPSGEKELLLRVPQYSFNWQLEFVLERPKLLPKWTRLEVSAGFDNSPNNKFNPDPTKEVRWGDQSWKEIMIGYFEVGFSPKLDLT